MGATRVYTTSGQGLLVSSHGVGRELMTRKMEQAGAEDARIPPGLHRRTDERLHIGGPLVALYRRPRHSNVSIYQELGE